MGADKLDIFIVIDIPNYQTRTLPSSFDVRIPKNVLNRSPHRQFSLYEIPIGHVASCILCKEIL